jgi:hypothetical protein
MSKSEFVIKKISKQSCASILLKYHYLKDFSKGFKSGFNYGLFKEESLVGCVIYSGFPVPELAQGMLGLARNEQKGLFELSRLCLHPDVQSSEHNLASWFVSKTIKLLRKETEVRVILSYADSDFHQGVVYRACNFSYYGLTTVKKDFWIAQDDGAYVKHSRGKTKGVLGEWRNRTRKHRFVLIFDKTLKILWAETKSTPPPTIEG